MRIYRLLLCLVLIVLNDNIGVCKNFNGHIQDMKSVSPFAEEEQRVEELYSLINDYIDQASFPDNGNRRTRHLDCVMNDSVFSKLGWGAVSNHGYWYHWGFNANIRQYDPLRRKINQAVANPQLKFDTADAERFWSLLNDDRAKRNKYLTKKVYPILGYSPTIVSARMRAQANAFVTIFYDVHMLGDLAEGKGGNNVKASAEVIFKECEDAIDNLAGKESNNYKKAQNLKNKLKKFHGTTVRNADPEQYLEMLKSEFPSFILSLGEDPSYNYKKKWDELGYRLKEITVMDRILNVVGL